MRVKTFKYRKNADDITLRTVAVTQLPSKHVSGYDLSELSAQEQREFCIRHNNLMDKFLSAKDALLAEFDLTHSYRQFSEEKMMEVEDKFV